MSFKKWNSRVKNLSCWDIKLLGLYSALAGLVIVRGIDLAWGWNLFDYVRIWWLIALAILVVIKPMISFFKKEKGEEVEIKSQEKV